MSDKITTEDCVKAICAHWDKAIDAGQTLPVGKYHGGPSDLIHPKNWKRVKKFGNAKDGFVRLFANVVVDEECRRAGEEAASKGRVDISSIVKWVMVVRATDDEIYDVAPGATIDGELVKPEEFTAKLNAAIAAAKGPTILGMPAACSVHGAPKAAAKEEDEEEESGHDKFLEQCREEHEEEERKLGPVIPGGAIVEYVNDKYFSSIERTTKAQMDKENKESYGGKKFRKQSIAPGAKFVMVACEDQEEFPIPVQSTIYFPKGGTCHAYDFGEGYSCDQSIWVEDTVGNIWSIAGEPADITDGAEDYIDEKTCEEVLKRTGGTVLLMQV